MTSARLVVITAICVLLLASSCKRTSSKLTTEWVVRRATMSGVCQVFDSQGSTVGDQIAGPFSTKDEATHKMCELRTTDPGDTHKCFDFNPLNACDTLPKQAAVELPEDVVRYLDSLPLVKVNVDDAILPNKKKLGD